MNNRTTETKAGIFVILGVALIGGMVIYFSNLQEQFTPRYNLTVMFPNASGLVKGSLVYMAGAKIGRVTEQPEIIQDAKGVRVAVKVYIDDNIKIRKGSKWTIGSAGLLGDRFVDVKPTANLKAPPLVDGQVIKGAHTPDIQDIAAKVEPLIEQARKVAANLGDITGKINNSLLTEQNSEEITNILIGADEMLTQINATMEAGKFEYMLADVRNILKNVDYLFGKAGSGVGPLYEIMADRETGDNLAAFIANLRTHGILFYSDSYEPGDGTGKNEKKVEASAVKSPHQLRE